MVHIKKKKCIGEYVTILFTLKNFCALYVKYSVLK